MPDDRIGPRLDESEASQREALGDAVASVREALDHLQPFRAHQDRILPGITKGVAEARSELETALRALQGTMDAHLALKRETTTVDIEPPEHDHEDPALEAEARAIAGMGR